MAHVRGRDVAALAGYCSRKILVRADASTGTSGYPLRYSSSCSINLPFINHFILCHLNSFKLLSFHFGMFVAYKYSFSLIYYLKNRVRHAFSHICFVLQFHVLHKTVLLLKTLNTTYVSCFFKKNQIRIYYVSGETGTFSAVKRGTEQLHSRASSRKGPCSLTDNYLPKSFLPRRRKRFLRGRTE